MRWVSSTCDVDLCHPLVFTHLDLKANIARVGLNHQFH